MCHACHAYQRGLRAKYQKRVNFSLLREIVPILVPRHANYSTWHANVPSCQRSANYSTWRANMPKGVPIFQLLLAKGVPIFQLFFKRIFQLLNFSIILNICKFLEHLGNSREFTRKTNNLNFDICKKPKTH